MICDEDRTRVVRVCDSSRRRHTRCYRDWSSDVCSSDLAIYALHWAARAGITFGGMKGGDFKKILKSSKDKVFAFAMVLGPLNDRIGTTGAGAIDMGFPAIANTDIPVVHPTGVTIYEEV